MAKKEVRFVSVSWTGVTVKTEIGVKICESLGYKAENIMVSVPIAYKALEINDADVFLGNWMPSMKTIANKYFSRGNVVKSVANMPGAKYTLAAPSYVVDGGLKDFSDIVKYGEQLDWKIYGIEEGNDGNAVIQDMIDKNMFGLKKFELVPSSEAGMLSQVQSFAREKKWVVFLGWAPHHMNEIIDMKYLTGSTPETFGENNGTAVVYTNTRKGFAQEYPNVNTLINNFKFPVSMMNQIMTILHNDEDLKPADAGIAWVKKHPEVYKNWFVGVKTADGHSGLEAFETYLASVK
nr:ABC transporter substrate-binding protein [Desulfoluna sp.]